MAKLVLLVVAAAWAAVLLPPLLRSRVENRPNSSVTDFRRQLNKLQSTAAPARGSMRTIGRPLAQSPLQRPAAPARPAHVIPHHRHSSVHIDTADPTGSPGQYVEPAPEGPRYRSHGDPSGAQRRPAERRDRGPRGHGARVDGHPRVNGHAHLNGHGHTNGHRQTQMARSVDPMASQKRRRGNVLFVLVVATACTLFLAATTSSTALMYAFAASFIALCGYVYLLAQIRQRQAAGWADGWLDHR